MKNLLVTMSFLAVMIMLSASTGTDSDKAEKAGWLLGAQSYTFHKFTYVETVDRMQKLGLKYVEVYYGQKLGEGFTGTMDYKMDKSTRQKVLNLTKSKGITIVASGVVICENNAEWDQLFEFAKSMGIISITSEPALDKLD
jgi:sugar phosphate isomerase/epimerase